MGFDAWFFARLDF
jgi:hypothetical protein